jgi:hypothetical protein
VIASDFFRFVPAELDLERAVGVDRKEHKDKGMWLISLGFRLTRRVIA